MFNKLFRKSSQPQQITGSVRVIGDRYSGKTTYMAALVRQPNANPDLDIVQSVKPLNEEGEELIRKATNLLEEGEMLAPTPVGAGIDSVKDYGIEINVCKESGGSLNLTIQCKDYPGEFFSDILSDENNPLLDDYIEDCLEANGLMLLLDGNGVGRDAYYALGLDRLLTLIDQSEIKMKDRRLAVVLTKCEPIELWINRNKPQLIARKFRKLMQTLQTWEKTGVISIDYFASSAFGMMGSHPPRANMKIIEKNRNGITASVLKQPKSWKPFGLVAPIHWLCTGKRHSKLDQE